MILKTEKFLAAGGDAIARADDGRIVFVEGACPEEQVDAVVQRDNKTFLRARVMEILEPSKVRVEPRCEYFGTCGGCTLQQVSIEAQRASKEQVVLETVARIGGAQIALEPTWTGDAYGYRTRARIAVEKAEKGGAIGYRRRDSNEVVDVERCPILAPPLQDELAALRREKQKQKLKPGEHELGGSGAGIFEQSNAAGNAAMIEYVRVLAGEAKTTLELYAGSGNFTRVLPGEVRAIEANAAATKLAAQRGLSIETAPVEEALARLEPGFELAVIDPPRTGASAKVISELLRLHPEKLISVSCDPATFARDVRRLGEAYRLDRLRVFDLYPQTSHIEVVGLLIAR